MFRIVSPKHRGWSQHVDKEFGNYDYLLGIDVGVPQALFNCIVMTAAQIDHRHPAVRKDLLEWATWILKVGQLNTSF